MGSAAKATCATRALAVVSEMAVWIAWRRAFGSCPGRRAWTVATFETATSTSGPWSINAFRALALWITSVGVRTIVSRYCRMAMPMTIRPCSPWYSARVAQIPASSMAPAVPGPAGWRVVDGLDTRVPMDGFDPMANGRCGLYAGSRGLAQEHCRAALSGKAGKQPVCKSGLY